MTSKAWRLLGIATDIGAMAAVYWTSPPWSMVVTVVYGLWNYHHGFTRGRML